MDGSVYPLLDIEVDKENYEDGFRDILAKIRPDWKGECLKFKKLPHGMLNLLVICYVTEEPDQSAIVFKVFGTFFSNATNRVGEIKVVKMAGEIGFSPKFYCEFKNGFAMQFVTGRTYDWSHESIKACHDPKIARMVAHNIALIHCKKTYESAKQRDIERFSGILQISAEQVNQHWSTPIRNDEMLTEYFYTGLPTKDDFIREMDMIKEVVKELTFTGMEERFIHCDANLTNYITDYVNERGWTVDLEFAGIGNPLQDLAWFLQSSLGLTNPDIEKARFSPEYEREFVKYYLQELRRLDEEEQPTEDEIDTFHVLVQKFYIILSLAMSTSAPHFVNRSDRIVVKDVLGNFRARLLLYFKNKDRILAM